MKNPFVTFQIPPTVDIDLAELTVRYRTLVTNHHPDKGGDAITMEDINKAYNILKNPLKRARALVELHGITITDEETLTDPAVLGEIFELRMNNNKDLISRKQQEAWEVFRETISREAYWRLLYLDKLSNTVCHPDERQDSAKLS